MKIDAAAPVGKPINASVIDALAQRAARRSIRLTSVAAAVAYARGDDVSSRWDGGSDMPLD
jgi:hypothetical protein